MIFVGDIAHPFEKPPEWGNLDWPWSPSQPVIANLEGPFIYGSNKKHVVHPCLFNHVSILESTHYLNIKLFTLANNHITDIPGGLIETLHALEKSDINITGAGATLSECSSPAKVIDNRREWLFLAFGWGVINCQYATQDQAGVNPLKADHVLRSIKLLNKEFPQTLIVPIMHWNYEMELYPQPAHRQLAKEAIDAGAAGVIGHHPHRVGGIELYKGCPIVYSLGNWWMPQGVFYGGKIKFADESLLQLALEWNPKDSIICHWFKYERKSHGLSYIYSELLSESERINCLTPYINMDHTTYKNWYKENRVRRKGLPIYYDYRDSLRNLVKDYYVRLRHTIISYLDISGIRRFLNL